MTKQDSGSEAHVFHQYIMLPLALNHRWWYCFWRVFMLKEGLTFYIVGVVANWATTSCFYRVEIAEYRRFLSCLTYHIWKKHAWIYAINFMWKNGVPILIKNPPLITFSEVRTWLQGARSIEGHWGYLPDHVEDRSFTNIDENVIVFLFLLHFSGGKNCFSLLS